MTLRARVSELSDQTFTKKEAWFVLNDELLKFVAVCDDDKLREEAFKIVKYLAENIPAAEELKDTELDRPFADELDLHNLVTPSKDGKVIKAEDLDK